MRTGPHRSAIVSRKGAEVVSHDVVHQPLLAEGGNQQIGNLLVPVERRASDFARLELPLLRGQEVVAQIGQLQPLARLADAGSAASEQIIALGLVQFKGLDPAVALDPRQLAIDDTAPLAEVVELAQNLLLPGAAISGAEGELRIGLGGLSRAALPRVFFRVDLPIRHLQIKGVGGVAPPS